MLSERCSESNILLEETHRRGQLRPADTMGTWWHHFQTPDHLRKTPWRNCTVVGLQRAYDIEGPAKEELACSHLFLDCGMERKDR